MSSAAMLGRGSQLSFASQLPFQMASLSLLNQHTSVMSGCSSGSQNRQFHGYAEYWKKTLFHHERKRRAPATRKFDSIVYKKKDLPDVFLSIKERLRELQPDLRDPELYKKVNIGMSKMETEQPAETRKRQRALMHALRQDKDLAKKARDNKLSLDTRAIQQDWSAEQGPSHVQVLAEHCGIFKDLYGPFAYFQPLVPLSVEYDYGDDELTPVYRGNIIKPREAVSRPTVRYNSSPDALWTLQLTNPDGDLYKPNSECIHWLVTNIKGSDVSSGDELVPYLAPVPPRGVGYQRMVFVLYRQTGPITDQQQYMLQNPYELRQRSFQTEQFYRRHEEVITPAGLCWFNTDWDTTLNQYYHDKLGMKEPVYEYEFPKPYLKQPTKYPKGRNFVFYMDMYRDGKELSQDMLLKRLKRLNPLKDEPPMLPYPDAQPINHRIPSWQSQEIKRERLGWAKYRELYRSDYHQDTLNDDDLLRDAAVTEVEKNHTLRLGVEWQKQRIGKRKAKELQKQLERAEAEGEDEEDQKVASAEKS